MTLLAAVGDLKNLLIPFLDVPLSELSKQLTPLDAAKLNATVAYALSTLHVCYLRLSGVQHTTQSVSLII